MNCGICKQPIPQGSDTCAICRIRMQRQCGGCFKWSPVDANECESCKKPLTTLPGDPYARPVTPLIQFDTGAALALQIIGILVVIATLLIILVEEDLRPVAISLGVLSCALFGLAAVLRRTEEIRLRLQRLEGLVRDRERD